MRRYLVFVQQRLPAGPHSYGLHVTANTPREARRMAYLRVRVCKPATQAKVVNVVRLD